MIGTAGPPVPYVEVCLESVPEMGYDALSKESPRGEICIRVDTLFSGYYKREDLTKEVLIDGLFHTGDMGEWQHDRSTKIIDRKKNIFKIPQGEYVAVENLENIFGQAPNVDSIWVYGNRSRTMGRDKRGKRRLHLNMRIRQKSSCRSNWAKLAKKRRRLLLLVPSENVLKIMVCHSVESKNIDGGPYTGDETPRKVLSDWVKKRQEQRTQIHCFRLETGLPWKMTWCKHDSQPGLGGIYEVTKCFKTIMCN